jgi:uncharacterized protein (DUF58 family)
VAVVLGWWVVAHSSGQGWVQALGDLVAGGLFVGVVGPWLVLHRIRLEVVGAPGDATAGLPLEVVLRLSRPARITPLRPAGPAGMGSSLTVIPAGRGVVDRLAVEVATAAPFGIQWWRRTVELTLARPIFVSPRRGIPWSVDPLVPDDGGRNEGASRRSGIDGDLRAPRPYRPGDARRLVHWPATAHTGELMVRELERPRGRPAELVVTLPADPAAAEAEAERALGTILALLERDVPVMLTTDEATGRRTAPVLTRNEAGRRMAAAV